MANPLRGTVPAQIRKVYYWAVGAGIVASGALQAGFEAAGDDTPPTWFKFTKAVLLYLGGGGVILAASNVTPPAEEGDQP